MILAVLALALVLRLGVIVATPHHHPQYDSADYNRHALSIADGDGFPDSALDPAGGPSAFRPPLYPYLLGGVYAVVGDSHGVTAGRVLGALFGVLVVLLIYLVADRIWGRRVGLVAALGAAVFPPLVLLNAALLTEPIFLAIELGVVLAVLASRRRGGDWRLAALAGVLCGLAALTRPNGVLLALVAAAAVWLGRPRFSRRALVAPLAVLVAMALTILPWTVRNAIVFDRFIPISSQSGFALAGAYSDDSREYHGHASTWLLPKVSQRYAALYARTDLDEPELDDKLRSSAIRYALGHPDFVVQTTALNTLRVFDLIGSAPVAATAERLQLGLSPRGIKVVKVSFYVLGLLALLGIAALIARPRPARGPLFLWLIPVLTIVAAVPIIGSTRYQIPAYPFLVFLAAIVVVDVAERLPARLRARHGARASGRGLAGDADEA